MYTETFWRALSPRPRTCLIFSSFPISYFQLAGRFCFFFRLTHFPCSCSILTLEPRLRAG